MSAQNAERERIIKEIKHEIRMSTTTSGEFLGGEFLERMMAWHLAEVARIVAELSQYVEHDSKCICSQSIAGRPTADGNYETLFGYGKDEKWYRRNEYPECSCGLSNALKRANGGE